MDKAKILIALIQLGYCVAKMGSTKARLIEFTNLLRSVEVGIPLIHVGSPHDRGYLLSDDLLNLKGLLSPSVGDNSGFEFA